MIIRKSAPPNFTRAVPLADTPAAAAASLQKTFSRHCLESGPVSLSDMARFKADATRYGGYHHVDGLGRYHP